MMNDWSLFADGYSLNLIGVSAEIQIIWYLIHCPLLREFVLKSFDLQLNSLRAVECNYGIPLAIASVNIIHVPDLRHHSVCGSLLGKSFAVEMGMVALGIFSSTVPTTLFNTTTSTTVRSMDFDREIYTAGSIDFVSEKINVVGLSIKLIGMT